MWHKKKFWKSFLKNIVARISKTSATFCFFWHQDIFMPEIWLQVQISNEQPMSFLLQKFVKINRSIKFIKLIKFLHVVLIYFIHLNEYLGHKTIKYLLTKIKWSKNSSNKNIENNIVLFANFIWKLKPKYEKFGWKRLKYW